MMREPAEPVGLSVLLIGGTSTTNIAVGDSVGADPPRDRAGQSRTRRRYRQVPRPSRKSRSSSCTPTRRSRPRMRSSVSLRSSARNSTPTSRPTPLLQRGREGRRRLTSTAGRDAWRRWEVSVVTPTRKARTGMSAQAARRSPQARGARIGQRRRGAACGAHRIGDRRTRRTCRGASRDQVPHAVGSRARRSHLAATAARARGAPDQGFDLPDTLQA